MTQSASHRGELPACASRCHADGGPPPAPGLRICAGCRERVEAQLADLPVLFDMCANMLDPRPHRTRERVGGRARRGIVLRDAVVSVRSQILAVLASWCGLVSAQRDVPGPDGPDIRRFAHHLAVHLPWLCGHPAAPNLVDQLAGLTDAVHQALRPDTGFRVRVGPCPHPGCPEYVHAEGHREGAAPYQVGCAGGHVWAPELWLLLWGRQNGLAHGSPAGEDTR
jgi:hypothetical protein